MLKNNDQKSRIIKLVAGLIIVLVAGFIYICIHKEFGFSIPCPIFLFTGLKCPGCGITTMIIEIINLNFWAAFVANPLTFCLLPVFIALIIYLANSYIQRGHMKICKWMNIGIVSIIIVYVVFGIVRNLAIYSL